MDEAKKEVNYDDFNTVEEAQAALDVELAELDDKLSELESEMPMIGPYDRPEYEAKADDISTRLFAIQDYASDDQYEYIEELLARCNSIPEIDYEGNEKFDPYEYNGVRRSDFM